MSDAITQNCIKRAVESIAFAVKLWLPLIWVELVFIFVTLLFK